MSALVGSLETQRAVEHFLSRQAEILDNRDWEAWLNLFTEDGVYWMPAYENQEEAEGQANIFYEDLDLMTVRSKRITNPRAWSQNPPNRTAHVVSNAIIESEDAASGDVVVRSKFYVAEYRMDEMRYFAGTYRHDLAKTDDGYRIRQQRVEIVNREGPFDYVIQYWL